MNPPIEDPSADAIPAAPDNSAIAQSAPEAAAAAEPRDPQYAPQPPAGPIAAGDDAATGDGAAETAVAYQAGPLAEAGDAAELLSTHPLTSDGSLSEPVASATADLATQDDDVAVVAAVAPSVSLPEPELGQRLRAAREARGWSVADVAARLHLPSTVVQSLESGNHARIGNGIYLRGYLLSYLRLLDLPTILLAHVAEKSPAEPPLVTTGAVSHPRYLYNRYSVPTIYLILTGLIVVPAVWLTTHGGLEQTLVRIAPLDTPAEAPLNASADPGASASPSSAVAAGATTASGPVENRVLPGPVSNGDAPLIASFTPPLSSAPATAPAPLAAAVAKETGAHHVRLSLTEESWVEILGSEGKRLDYGLLPAGTQHEYYSDTALDIRIGNSNGATLEVDGHAMDLAPYRHANVARLKLFTEGEKSTHSDS